MTFIPVSLLDTPLDANDWLMTILVLVFLLMLLIMGPHAEYYSKTVSSMYRFNNPDSDVTFPPFSPFGFVAVFILSCIGMGFTVFQFIGDVSDKTTGPVGDLFMISAMLLVVYAVRLLIYQMVNSILYRSQTINLKPTRWNGFYVATFSAACFVVLVFSAFVLFLRLPLLLLPVFVLLLRIIVVVGRIFKIKTALFKNNRSKSGFILYLCALEIVPMILTFVIWAKLISLT